MNLKPICLYRGRLSELAGKSGVRFRQNRKGMSTLVPCEIEAVDGRSVAKPCFEIPPGTPPGFFRLQLEMSRMPVGRRESAALLISAERPVGRTDPEQTILAPIYDDGRKMIFEFTRAYALIVRQHGEVELRLIAIQPATGTVGTKAVYRFHARWAPLALRGVEYIRGDVELFPQPAGSRARSAARPVPTGEADLSLLRPADDPTLRGFEGPS